jgi:hypothetical protein
VGDRDAGTDGDGGGAVDHAVAAPVVQVMATREPVVLAPVEPGSAVFRLAWVALVE